MPTSLTLTAASPAALTITSASATSASPTAESGDSLTLTIATPGATPSGELYPNGDNAYPDHPNAYPSNLVIPVDQNPMAASSTALTLIAA